jgi:hypothetical protein
MSNIHRSTRRIAHVTIVGGALLLPAVAPSASGPGAPGGDLQRLASEARTADLRGNWEGLSRAHEAVAAMRAPAAGRAWIDYYLGYIDWRQSSLAFMGEGASGTIALLRQAAEHLLRALEAVPGFTEARLLLVIVDGGTMVADPPRAAHGQLSEGCRRSPGQSARQVPARVHVVLSAGQHARGERRGARVVEGSGGGVSGEAAGTRARVGARRSVGLAWRHIARGWQARRGQGSAPARAGRS